MCIRDSPCAADLPRFMVDTVAGAYAPADAELMIEGFGAAVTRPVTLRANTLKATAEDIAAALDAAGIAHNPVAWYPDAFILPEAQVSDLWDLDIYRDGKIYLQSLSSMMPPLVLGAQAGEDILDMCAAPGGKTTQIAALTQGQAHLTACEMSIPRAEKLESNLHRQGAKNVPVMRIDARELDEFFRFDRILLDAPCTGTGTVISGNEKSLRGLTEQLLSKCARSQRALLDLSLIHIYQRQAIATAQKTAAAAEVDRDAHAAKATELKSQFEQMKTEDDATELRLKAALDAVEAREASSRETGNRLIRRLEDSKRIRDKVKAERDAGIAAAQQTVDATRAQLETLRHEYAELQRNPSANPANYTVRTSELSMQISDTADALRKTEEDVPRITADLEHSLAAAEQAVEQAQAPIAEAKRAHQAVTAEADAARDELQTAKTAAATRQRELREKIAAEDKARRDQEQSIANAQADAAHAQSIIEQANEVHDHPEITESLAGSLARDKAEHAETEREVTQLEATEDAVRERTRDSRIKFTGAIVCIVAAILAIILVWLFASK